MRQTKIVFTTLTTFQVTMTRVSSWPTDTVFFVHDKSHNCGEEPVASPDGPVGGIHRQRVRVGPGRPEVLSGVTGAALVATLHTQPDAVGQLGSGGYRL